ncbi:MAG: hypothetical protein MZV70_74410, partial [Desulfobacterales bacterium]|nr:hypothetical protein [Desulfobacterales bacterium]
MMLIGYIFVSFSFSGSATPAYAADKTAVPSYGRGSWELIIFTDYFCPPCQSVEKDLEPEIRRASGTEGMLKSPLWIFRVIREPHSTQNIFFTAVAADKGYPNVLKARNILFSWPEKVIRRTYWQPLEIG